MKGTTMKEAQESNVHSRWKHARWMAEAIQAATSTYRGI